MGLYGGVEEGEMTQEEGVIILGGKVRLVHLNLLDPLLAFPYIF